MTLCYCEFNSRLLSVTGSFVARLFRCKSADVPGKRRMRFRGPDVGGPVLLCLCVMLPSTVGSSHQTK